MFDNVGSKLKTTAVVLCYLGIAASVIAGLSLIAVENIGGGFLYAIVGSVASWLSSLSLYAFGELVIYVKMIAKNTKTTTKSKNSNDITSENQKTIKKFVKDESAEEEDVVELVCPECMQTTKFPKSILEMYENPYCPHCKARICGDNQEEAEE